jgi:hypothetical protein
MQCHICAMANKHAKASASMQDCIQHIQNTHICIHIYTHTGSFKIFCALLRTTSAGSGKWFRNSCAHTSTSGTPDLSHTKDFWINPSSKTCCSYRCIETLYHPVYQHSTTVPVLFGKIYFCVTISGDPSDRAVWGVGLNSLNAEIVDLNHA